MTLAGCLNAPGMFAARSPHAYELCTSRLYCGLMAAQDVCWCCGAQVFGDSEYLQSVLNMLPGVDPSDPAVQSTLRSLQGGAGDRKEDGAGGEGKGQQ